jgi:hypothetical protein
VIIHPTLRWRGRELPPMINSYSGFTSWSWESGGECDLRVHVEREYVTCYASIRLGDATIGKGANGDPQQALDQANEKARAWATAYLDGLRLLAEVL